jgi:hypothetical protein
MTPIWTKHRSTLNMCFLEKYKLTLYWQGEYWIILNVFPFWVRKEWIDGYDKERKSIVGELKRNWPEKMQKGNILMFSWMNEWMNTWAVEFSTTGPDRTEPNLPHRLAIAHRLSSPPLLLSILSHYLLILFWVIKHLTIFNFLKFTSSFLFTL